MLAILQSLRKQQPGWGVTGDSGRFGSAFMLCHSWDSFAEVCLPRGSTLEKIKGFFSSVLILQANKCEELKIAQVELKVNPFLCQHGWGCPTQAACPGTKAELLQSQGCRPCSLSLQVTCSTVPCSTLWGVWWSWWCLEQLGCVTPPWCRCLGSPHGTALYQLGQFGFMVFWGDSPQGSGCQEVVNDP